MAFSGEARPAPDAGWVAVRAKKTRQNSEPFAGVGVAHRCREEAEPEGQHDDIKHEVLLVTPASARNGWAFQGKRMQSITAGCDPGPSVISDGDVPLAA
jgi:hypothetical protein